MYVPKHFELDGDRVATLLATAETAQLVTAHPDGPVATLLPVAYRPAEPGGDPLGSLVLHVTRVNSQWKDPHLGDALAILDGPDAYVDPAWVPSHAEAPGVPTWNYVTVHCYGDLVAHDDPDWTRAAVEQLSARHGYDTGQVDPGAIERMHHPGRRQGQAVAEPEPRRCRRHHRRPRRARGVRPGGRHGRRVAAARPGPLRAHRRDQVRPPARCGPPVGVVVG